MVTRSRQSKTSWLRFLAYFSQGCQFSVIFRFFCYFWPDSFSIFSYFIFLFLNFLSLFVFIFCETARTRRFSVIFAKVQWHPCFQLISMKCDVVLKQFKLNIMILLLSEILWNKGNSCCLLIAPEANIGVDLGICLKLGVMIATTELWFDTTY